MSELLIEKISEDLITVETETLQEGLTKVKNFYIKGPFLQAEVVNGNKRIYPKPVIEREVYNYQSIIKENRAFGELNHPNTTELNPERFSHKIIELYMEGNTAIGKAKVLDKPEFKCGQIIRALIEEGVKVGISSRGTGTLKNGVVQENFSMKTVDCVWTPSGPNCFLDGIVESKKEWVYENGILTETEVNQIKQEADKVIIENKFSIQDRQAAFMKIFTDIMSKISSKSK